MSDLSHHQFVIIYKFRQLVFLLLLTLTAVKKERNLFERPCSFTRSNRVALKTANITNFDFSYLQPKG